MNNRFLREAGKLKSQLVYLSGRVEEQLTWATEAVVERDAEKGQRVVTGDKAIDALEVELEEECLKILALHQPVASDLRLVVAILKMNNDLERIGDLAVNVAKNAIFLAGKNEVAIPFDFYKMASHAQIMVSSALKSLTRGDASLAHDVREMDDALDDINDAMYDITKAVIQKHPENLEHYIHMASISRALERIGDLAVNMAEDVVYLYEGHIIRHSGHPKEL